MPRALARLLGRSDRMLTLTIDDLEKSTGKQGIDSRLVGDVLHKSHKVLRKLGLDSIDTTALELYNMLRSCDGDDVLEGTDYSGIFFEGECMSLCKQDLELDTKNDVAFEDRSLTYMRSNLEKEIGSRYKNSHAANDKVITRILLSLNQKNN